MMPQKKIIIPEALENGMRFSCQFCGRCCRGLDEGDVYIYKEELFNIVKFLNGRADNELLRQFAERHLKIAILDFYWKENGEEKGKHYKLPILGFKFTGKDDHCEFLSEDNTCTIYEVAPYQCHSFPWWQIHLKNPNSLKKYSKKCPGLAKGFDDEGKMISSQEILDWVNGEREIEEEYFLTLRKVKFDIFKLYDFLPSDIESDVSD